MNSLSPGLRRAMSLIVSQLGSGRGGASSQNGEAHLTSSIKRQQSNSRCSLSGVKAIAHMGSTFSKAVQSRYHKDFDEAVDGMSLAKREELYRELQVQMSQLTELEDEITNALVKIDADEADLKSKEQFLEMRRISYLKQLGLWNKSEQPEDASDSEDEEDEEDENELVKQEEGPTSGASKGQQQSLAAQAGGRIEEAGTWQPVQPPQTPTRPAVADAAGEAAGCNEVKGGLDDERDAKLRAFLEEELPSIQSSVALSVRTLGWKKADFQKQLEDTKSKVQKVQHMLDVLAPGLPVITNAVDAARV